MSMITPELKKLAEILGTTIMYNEENIIRPDGSCEVEYCIYYPKYDGSFGTHIERFKTKELVCDWLRLQIAKHQAA